MSISWGSDDELRKISETQYKKIIKMFNDQVDKEVSAMTTVLSSWGRDSEISELYNTANIKKDEFAKFFKYNSDFHVKETKEC